MALPMRVNRTNEVAPFDALHRDFDSILGNFFGAQPSYRNAALAPYAVDVREDADHLYVEAELPGYKKDEVDITLEDHNLTISAERRSEKKGNGEGGDMLLNERRYSRFLRSFTLPSTVDDQKVDAKLNDGVLTITLNKREESKPRRIAVD